MERPPTPPCPSNSVQKNSFFDSFVNSSSDNYRKNRTGRLFPPLTPSSTDTSISSVQVVTKPTITLTEASTQDDAYAWAEVEDRGRTLIHHPSHSSSRSASASSSSSASSSRSPTPAFDERPISNMLLTGKAPPTPIPATPIMKISRQLSFTKEKIIVGVRLRPFIVEDHRLVDAESNQSVVSMKTDGPTATVQVQSRTGSMVFYFDHGFSSFKDDDTTIYADQKTVYCTLAQPLVHSMIAGFNCSFFAYGQTGTGKTFSTLGTDDNPGVVPRFCQELLQQIEADNGEETWKLEISYLEIYKEDIIDLLADRGRKKPRVREHPEEGPFVENLVSKPVSNYDEIKKLLDEGNYARHKASTNRNDGSSRSHAVFSLKLIQMTVSL